MRRNVGPKNCPTHSRWSEEVVLTDGSGELTIARAGCVVNPWAVLCDNCGAYILFLPQSRSEPVRYMTCACAVAAAIAVGATQAWADAAFAIDSVSRIVGHGVKDTEGKAKQTARKDCAQNGGNPAYTPC